LTVASAAGIVHFLTLKPGLNAANAEWSI